MKKNQNIVDKLLIMMHIICKVNYLYANYLKNKIFNALIFLYKIYMLKIYNIFQTYSRTSLE